MRIPKSIAVATGLTLLLLLSSILDAQTTASTPKLRGTIKDPSGAVMPGVDTVVLQDGLVVKAGKTDSVGTFSFDLPAGQYQLAVTAPDFQTHRQLVRVAANMAPLSVTLLLEGITATVDVAGDDDKPTVDASLSLDATTIKGEKLDELPEDEESLLAYLQNLAGGQGNAQLIIDGFEGGRLPTRDQIAQIIIEPNSFNANGTGPRITIVSRTPGPTRWDGNASFQYQDSSFNARNPHSENKPPSRRSVFSTSYRGPLIKGKLGMTISISKQQSEAQNNSIRAITPFGPVNTAFVSPSTYDSATISHQWFLATGHTLSHSFSYNRSKNLNQGIGGFTLEERASDGKNHGWNFQVADNFTISPKMTNTFQFRTNRNNTRTTPRTNAIAINVLDAFNGGGGQNLSETSNTTYNLNNILRWTPTPKWNLQFAFNANYQSNYSSLQNNYLGTFTFSSLEDYLAERPLTFTQTSGNPVAEANQKDANVSLQATYRIQPTMSLSMGAQYAIQSHLKDYNNVSPTTQFQVQVKKRSIISLGARLSRPTAGFPLFYYEQLIRGDGTTRQFNTVISNPSFDDPLGGGAAGSTTGVGSSRQIRDEHLVSPYTINTQVALNQSLPKNWRFTATFNVNRAVHQIRSRNINAPFPGIPLDPTLTQAQIDQLKPLYPLVARINQFESTGNSLSRNLNFMVQIPSTRKFLNTQVSGILQYGLTWAADDNSAQNPYNVRADWARNDQRHRLSGNLSIRPPKVGSFNFNFNANSGRAYSITTGRDDNFDQNINDRPAGVERNSLRGPGSYTVDLNYSTPSLNFRKKKAPVAEATTGAAGTPAPVNPTDALIQSALNAGLPAAAIQQLIASMSAQPGFIGNAPAAPVTPPSLTNPRITFSVNVRNLFNNTRVNGYSGVITSPLFGRPTGYGSGRTIQFSLNSQF